MLRAQRRCARRSPAENRRTARVDAYLQAWRDVLLRLRRARRERICADVERRLARVSQRQYNLTAERGVAARRIEATQGVLARGSRNSAANECARRRRTRTRRHLRIRRRGRDSVGRARCLHRPGCASVSRETFYAGVSAGRAVDHDRLVDLALHRYGLLARIGAASRAIRRRQSGRRRGRVHDRRGSSVRCSRRSWSRAGPARRSRPNSARWS